MYCIKVINFGILKSQPVNTKLKGTKKSFCKQFQADLLLLDLVSLELKFCHF